MLNIISRHEIVMLVSKDTGPSPGTVKLREGSLKALILIHFAAVLRHHVPGGDHPLQDHAPQLGVLRPLQRRRHRDLPLLPGEAAHLLGSLEPQPAGHHHPQQGDRGLQR